MTQGTRRGQPGPALDATYRARAVPLCTTRYWSWLFADAQMRPPLLGMFALLAEWIALTDASTERSVAQLKLAWWQTEIRRLAVGAGVHPICIYLQSLPRAATIDFMPLALTLDAASLEVSGAPLQHAAGLAEHADALFGLPLILAAQFLYAQPDPDDARRLADCTAALAAADYLSRALRDYRSAMRVGRVVFPVDELLAADIDNADLAHAQAPAHLVRYLDGLRERARGYYARAAAALPARMRSRQRHLLVMEALGRASVQRRTPMSPARRMQDMLLAWTTARRSMLQSRHAP